MLRRLLLFLPLFISLAAKAQFAYGHQMEFGKNRIQYKAFVWTYLDYDRYRVYSYQGGNEIAKYVSYSLSKQLAMIEKRLDYQIEDKINVLVYNNQNDFKQSNLGLSSEEQTNIGGYTKIIGDKVSVYFNGSHTDLDQQLRAVVAELLISKILYGGNAREVIRNSTLLYLPPWFSQGLVKYLSEGWTSKNDDIVFDALKNDNFGKFSRLTGKQADNAGQALWYFIVSTYGESMIPNVLYMTRLTRSLDHAFLTTLGVTLDNLIYDFTESYQRRIFMYQDPERHPNVIAENSVLKRYRSTRAYYQVKVSPDGNQVIYSRNELNQWRVYLKTYDEEGKIKTKRLLKKGPKVEQIEDNNYPLLAWHPNGEVVTMIYPEEDELILRLINLNTKENVKRNLVGFEKINSISYSHDGKKIAMSAVKRGKGQSDIFVFGVNTSAVEQLTNDIWDDANPVFVRSSKQIVFESNRVNDTIKPKDDASYFEKLNRNADLFMAPYPFTSKVLVRITNTPFFNEVQPQVYKDNYVAYLSDKNGIFNRYLAEYDSAISYVDTTEHYRFYFKSKPVSNNDRNIQEHNINANGSYVAERMYYKGRDWLARNPLPDLNAVTLKEPVNTWFRSNISSAVNNPADYRDLTAVESASVQKGAEETKGIDFDNYKFEGEKDANGNDKPGKVGTLKKDSLQKTRPGTFKFPIQRNYYTAFYTDYVVSQLDNSFFTNNYQKFSGGSSPVYLNPGFNILNKIAISDLFEDQRIMGGFRINSALDNEFMVSWEQRKNLYDHQVVLDRQTFASSDNLTPSGSPYTTKLITNSVRYSAKYPFSPVSAMKASLLYRNDKTVYLSQGDFTLPKANDIDHAGGARIEYIFDNTRKVMLNILNGFRFKAWTEYWQYTDVQGNNLFTSGFDARHYLKVHRQITWCNRFAGGNSSGSKRLLFYLGGVDNWLFPTFNNSINIIKPEQYGFQTLATNLRGFNQNTRNGNNFLVYNSELRIPVVRYLLNYPVKSDFLNNLQVIGFGDLGMAWYGSKPLSSENTENIKTYTQTGTNVVIKVINNKNPLVGGAGFGFRSRLLGYFVRLDFGWGIDNWVVQKRVVGLSLATDF